MCKAHYYKYSFMGIYHIYLSIFPDISTGSHSVMVTG